MHLIDIGSENVVETILKIRSNVWPKDERMKKSCAIELCHFMNGIINMFARGYTQTLAGDPAYFEVVKLNARWNVWVINSPHHP
jgi:uncharacterized protein (UPF0305 family)